MAFLIDVAFLQQVSALIGEMRRRAPIRDEEEEGPDHILGLLIVMIVHSLALWEFILALLLWYCDQATLWRRCLTGAGFGALILIAGWTLLREAYYAIKSFFEKEKQRWEERKELDEREKKDVPKGHVRRQSLATV